MGPTMMMMIAYGAAVLVFALVVKCCISRRRRRQAAIRAQQQALVVEALSQEMIGRGDDILIRYEMIEDGKDNEHTCPGCQKSFAGRKFAGKRLERHCNQSKDRRAKNPALHSKRKCKRDSQVRRSANPG